MIKRVIYILLEHFTTGTKIQFNTTEANRRGQFIQDITKLNNAAALTDNIITQLQTPLYKAQFNSFLNRLTEQKAALAKAQKEYDMNAQLRKDNVISPKEFFDVENALQRANASYQSFIREQKSQWLQQLAQYQSEAAQYRQQQQQTQADARYYTIKAPTAGVVQGINTIYNGGILQAGETICTISPEGELIAECYVDTRDVGLLKTGQEARFQIDAFDYNYFGILTGKIISIDNDYTLVENQPVFKVRCSFDSQQLHLKNGFTGQLKKGLSLQARFVIAERTLWQLLFDKIDDWLNPAAPKTAPANG